MGQGTAIHRRAHGDDTPSQKTGIDAKTIEYGLGLMED